MEPNFITQFTVSLSAGQKLRATLAFSNKNTNAIIQNGLQYYDMDLRLVDAATGAVLSAAEESRNNVEIVEYTASAARSVCVQTRIGARRFPCVRRLGVGGGPLLRIRRFVLHARRAFRSVCDESIPSRTSRTGRVKRPAAARRGGRVLYGARRPLRLKASALRRFFLRFS